MSDLRMNSVLGAVLASALGVLGLGAVSGALFEPHYPEKAGYAPEVDLSAHGGGGGGPAAPVGPPDFGRLFADQAQLTELIARGERVHGVCTSCHNFDAGGPNGTGPNLHDVFGRRSGTHPGFAYSDAMAHHDATWSYDTLDAYLTSPARAVPGNKMAFAGIRNTDDRVALIAFLRSISPNNVPLPAPLPEAAPAEAAPSTGSTAAAPATGGATPATPPAH